MSDSLDEILKRGISSSESRQKRHPDYVKISDFSNFKISISIWIDSDKATLVVSTFENSKWTQKLKEELPRWK